MPQPKAQPQQGTIGDLVGTGAQQPGMQLLRLFELFMALPQVQQMLMLQQGMRSMGQMMPAPQQPPVPPQSTPQPFTAGLPMQLPIAGRR